MDEESIDAVENNYFEEDFSSIFGFDDNDAWSRLHSLPNVIKICISPQSQVELGIVVGCNVSDEHRWKEFNKDKLQAFLQPVGEKEAKLVEKLQELDPGSSILIEYLPEQSNNEDVFLVYSDVMELNEASEIVRKLELLERLKLKMLTEKTSVKKWVSECGDRDIERWKRIPEVPQVDTQVQSVYPIRKGGSTMRWRNSNDARDGYMELLPVKWKTTNMPRKITDRATQVRPPAFSRIQQTDPTFPSHAATQYLFDAADCEIGPFVVPGAWLRTTVDALSKEVQFNLIDSHRNEYRFISEKMVQAYRTPKIDEVLTFMNRAKCAGRNVCSLDWHPEISGFFAASYTFEIFSKKSSNPSEKSELQSGDSVNRTTFEKNPVLMWSFADPLEPLLELKTIREVTTISFCPYDGELLVGGLTNGQIVLWDLKGEMERVELLQQAARDSNEYRKEIRRLMEDPPEEGIDRSVSPAAVSSLDRASKSAISCIKWLPRNYCCTSAGRLKAHPDKFQRFLVTSSLDGSVCFWDLDFTMPALQKMLTTGKGTEMVQKTLYQRVNNLFFPQFKLLSQTSIVSMIVDEAMYLSVPQENTTDITKCVKHHLQPLAMDCKMSLTLGTFTGQLIGGRWEGYDFEQASLVNDETLQVSYTLSPIHDGPIVALERNPACADAFLSIGGHVLALWSEGDLSSPIFWRKKGVMITAGRWSLNRTAVFFIGLANGDFEIWDLNKKMFRASISMNLGADALTVISQHRLASARHCLAIADCNANIRILSIAPAFVHPIPNEDDTFREIIQHELTRKSSLQNWIKGYYERNSKKATAQVQAETDAKEIELRQEREPAKKADARVAKTAKLQEIDKRMPLSDRLEQQYRASQFQRLLKRLMERRNVSPQRMAREIRPEVERRKYKTKKRTAIDASISQAASDFSNVCRVLRPPDKAIALPVDARRGMAAKYKQNMANYRHVESEAKKILRANYLPEMESFTEVLVKSKERRDSVCIDVGANMEHLVSYESKRSRRRLGVAPRTLLEELRPISSEESRENDDMRHGPKGNVDD